jgi:hypothetical protein
MAGIPLFQDAAALRPLDNNNIVNPSQEYQAVMPNIRNSMRLVAAAGRSPLWRSLFDRPAGNRGRIGIENPAQHNAGSGDPQAHITLRENALGGPCENLGAMHLHDDGSWSHMIGAGRYNPPARWSNTDLTAVGFDGTIDHGDYAWHTRIWAARGAVQTARTRVTNVRDLRDAFLATSAPIFLAIANLNAAQFALQAATAQQVGLQAQIGPIQASIASLTTTVATQQQTAAQLGLPPPNTRQVQRLAIETQNLADLNAQIAILNIVGLQATVNQATATRDGARATRLAAHQALEAAKPAARDAITAVDDALCEGIADRTADIWGFTPTAVPLELAAVAFVQI